MMGVGDTPLRLPSVEAAMESREATTMAITEAVAVLRDSITPSSDLHASRDYRRHLAGVLAERALVEAWRRAGRAQEKAA